MTKPTGQECNRRIPPAIFEGRRCLIGRAVIAGGLAGSEARAGRYGLPPTQRARMDEDAGRSDGKPALWDAFAVRERRHQEHFEDFAAIFVGIRTDAVAGSRRHHHTERSVHIMAAFPPSIRRSTG